MIGILALQGCVEPHEKHFSALGINTQRVRSTKDFENISGLVVPGGESSTMLHLLQIFEMVKPFQEKAKEIPYWGICAGAILMAKSLEGTSRSPNQFTLKIMNFSVERNAYGRQLESFTDTVDCFQDKQELATFIRAPKFTRWENTVEVFGKYREEAVFLSEGKHMATAFHPELSPNLNFHRYFAERCFSK